MKAARPILRKFIKKGGLIGRIARMYLNDTVNAGRFLLELKAQLKNNKSQMIAIWGKDLIKELEEYHN